MDISTNKVRIGSMVHSLCESGIQTRCRLQGVVVTMAPWIYGEKVDSPVDCMTCLVDREPAYIREARLMGAAVADEFMAKLAQTMK